MLALSLIWLALGALLGAVAVAARLIPARGRRWRGLAQASALGALAALGGGWLGALLLDQLFATFVALWLSVAVVAVAGLLARRAAASARPR